MSRTEVMDTTLTRHPIAVCDKCGDRWTVNVCKLRGWLLSDAKDLCERCKPRRTRRAKP